MSFAASAKEFKINEEKEIAILAEELKFIFEEAVIKDADGKPIGVDIKVIESKFGTSPELEQLKKEMQTDLEQNRLSTKNSDIITIQSAAVDRCIERKIKAGFKEVFSIATYTTIITYMWEGNYTLAAKHLLKVGVKGNAAGIAATLLYYLTTCIYEEEGWF